MFRKPQFYTEQDGDEVTVSAYCVVTGQPYSVRVKARDWARWRTGHGYVQTVFSYLSAEQREFLLSGMSPDGWNQVFPPQEG